MFEKIAKECCNYSNKYCIGGFFHFDKTGAMIATLGNRAGEKCLVLEGEYCEWFHKIVKPPIIRNYYLSRSLAEYEKALTRKQVKQEENKPEPEDGQKYKLKCRECGVRFQSDSPNKRYCPDCKGKIHKKNLCKASKRFRQSQSNKSAPVSAL